MDRRLVVAFIPTEVVSVSRTGCHDPTGDGGPGFVTVGAGELAVELEAPEVVVLYCLIGSVQDRSARDACRRWYR